MRDYNHRDVKIAIKRTFPNYDETEILKIINPDGLDNYDRVQLAILKLSKGSREKLLEMSNLARSDFRDVLMLSEYLPDGTEIKCPYQEIGVS